MAPITPSTATAPNSTASGRSSPITSAVTASALATRAFEAWVEASIRRRSIRSASVPATGASTTARPDRTAMVSPTARALPVISYTSHTSARWWAHIPAPCRNWALA